MYFLININEISSYLLNTMNVNTYFLDWVKQLKQSVLDNKFECVISYELYGPNVYSSERKSEPLTYFLWYVIDQGFTYEITEEVGQVNDAMEGWCHQKLRYITIKLK